MKKAFSMITFALVTVGAALQEAMRWRSHAPEPAKVAGAIEGGSSSLLPTLTGLIEERKKDFDTIVFGSTDGETNELSDAEGNALLFKNFSRVEAEGRVVMLVESDAQSGELQRFIVKLASGNLLLITHDLRVAPPVQGLALGDKVAFAGEYAYGQNGDEVSKTHRDPTGARKAGYIRHNGRTYQ